MERSGSQLNMANKNRTNQHISSGHSWSSTESLDHRDMSLPSPVDQYGNKLSGSGYGSSGQSDSGKSPLSMSLGFLKTLTEKKSARGMWDDVRMWHLLTSVS
jgi:hypothetical protein